MPADGRFNSAFKGLILSIKFYYACEVHNLLKKLFFIRMGETKYIWKDFADRGPPVAYHR